MKQRYSFSSITIARAPGFGANRFPVIEEFSDSLNIIYGPNGIGKSTLLRTLRSLIYQRETEAQCEAFGRLRIGDDVWELERNGKVVKHMRQSDGAIIDLPGVNEEFRESYWFALHELVAPAMQHHSIFFETAKRQMQGGIDLDQTERELETIGQFPGKALKEAKTVAAAKTNLNESIKRIRATRNLGEEIRSAKARLDEQPELQARSKRLEEIRSYLELKQTYGQLEAEAAEYDRRLDVLKKTSLESLSNLEKAVSAAQDSVDAEQKELAALAQRLEELAVPQELLDDNAIVDRLEDEIREAENLHIKLQNSKEQLLQKRGELESWSKQHDWFASEPPEEEALRKTVSSLGKLAQSDESLRSAVQAGAKLLKRYPKPTENDAARRSELIEQKHKLLHLASGKEKTSKLYWILLAVIALLSGGGIYLGMSGLIRGSVVLWAVSAMLLVVLGRKVMRNLTGGRTLDIKEFVDYFKAPPSTTYDQVLNLCFSELSELEEKMRVHNEVQAEFEEAKKRYDEHVAACREIYDVLGIPHDPTLEGARFFNVGEHLRSWSGLLGTVRAQEALVNGLLASFDRRINGLEALCQSEFKNDPLPEARRFLDRLKQARSTRGTFEHYRTSLGASEERLARAEDERREWYERYEIESWDVAETLFDQMEQYKKLAEELELQKRALAKVDRSIIEEAQHIDREALDIEFEKLQRTLNELETVYEHSIKLQERYRSASRTSEYEDALFEYESALGVLDAHRKDVLKKRLAHSIIADLKEQTEREHQPAVIQRSSAWLQRITHNRYSLNAGKDDFRAFDHGEDRSLALEELSSGTRIQLLFALRMGYLESLEEGGNAALPIFFDEIMANSDDDRSLAIAEAIGSIAEERQVFYATAQADEVKKLESQAQSPPLLVDLKQLQSKEATERQPFTAAEPLPRKEIPFEPEYHQYAKTLMIAQADLFTPIEQLSSWYLCLDSKELHELLRRNLDRAGTARRSSALLSKRFNLLKEAQRLARAGREKTLTPADLSDPDLILNRSANYYQSIATFVSRNEVTGSGLLEAIAEKKEIKNISSDTLQVITDWLAANSFLSEENAHSKDEIIALLSTKHDDLTAESDEQLVLERYLSHILDARR